MPQIGGKNAKKTSSNSKRHFTVVMGNKEHGLYVSSTPSSAAKKAVTKLCAANKSKKVDFHIREITQGSKKKTYGPYVGYIEKLKEPIELKGRVIRYKPVAKLSGKTSVKKGGMRGGGETVTKKLREKIEEDLVLNPEEQKDNDILLALDFLDGKTVDNISEVMSRLGEEYQDIKQKIRGVHHLNIKENDINKMLIASAVYSELTRVGIPGFKSKRIGVPDSKPSPSKDNAKAILETFVNLKHELKNKITFPSAIYYLYNLYK
jgi:hypothetical protein